MKIKIKKSILRERVRRILKQSGRQLSLDDVEKKYGKVSEQLINTVGQQALQSGKKLWSAYVNNDKLQIKLSDGTTMRYDFIEMGPQELIAKVSDENDKFINEIIWDGYDWKNK